MRILGFDIRRAQVEQKASAVGGSIVLNPGQPRWTQRDYAAFAREAYVQNNVAYRCISSVAEAVASVPLMIKKGDAEIVQGPLHDLLQRPNPMQSWNEYVEALVSFLLISGNGYEEAVTGAGREVRELYVLRPDRMKVVAGTDGMPVAYEYKVNQRTTRFDMTQNPPPINHTRLFHPTDDWYGLAPVEAGAFAVDTHNEAYNYVKSYLQNSAKPSGALVTKDGQDLGAEQFDRLKAQIEDQYQGSGNAGRPMLLEGGLDWKAIGGAPKDAMLIDVKNSAARDICLSFGVPPMLIGIPGDNTYSNYSEARLAFWEDTVVPLLGRLLSSWNNWLAEPLGLEIEPDLDQVPAIIEKRQVLWQMLQASDALTVNEKREAMGYEPIPGGDELITPQAAGSMGPDELRALAYGLEAKG